MVDHKDQNVLLRRQLTWDLIPCPDVNKFMPKVTLVPGSDEGVEVEHRAHHRRLNAIMPILPQLAQTADLAGAIMGRHLLDVRDKSYTEQEATEQIQETVQVSRALAMAIIANLVEYGYLHLPHRVGGS